MTTLRDIGEFRLIERLLARAHRVRPPGKRVLLAPGDDAAVSVVEPGRAVVSTTDMLVEGVDFKSTFPPFFVGWKAIAVNLSDVHAVGGQPTGVLVAVSAPPTTEIAWLESAYDGIAEICAERAIDLLGGDVSTSGSGGITFSVTAIGEVDPGRIVRRSGARAGDVICVTGTLGGASAGLELLLAGDADSSNGLVLRQLQPTPPPIGFDLAASGVVHAMIDVSDGFLADLGHLLDASGGLGARIETAKLPISGDLERHGRDVLRHALAGGEDFELLFTVEPSGVEEAQEICRGWGSFLTAVGTVLQRPGTSLVRADGTELPPPGRSGWDHFRSRS